MLLGRSERADPRSRDLDRSRRDATELTLGRKKKPACGAEDDNMHLNFEPVLSRLMGGRRAVEWGLGIVAPAFIFPYVFYF